MGGVLKQWRELQVVCPGLILSSQSYLGNERTCFMLRVGGKRLTEKQKQKDKKKTKKKSSNVSAHTEFAISPCDAAITCSFKGVLGLQATFSLNRVSFHLPFPATLRCAPY